MLLIIYTSRRFVVLTQSAWYGQSVAIQVEKKIQTQSEHKYIYGRELYINELEMSWSHI